MIICYTFFLKIVCLYSSADCEKLANLILVLCEISKQNDLEYLRAVFLVPDRPVYRELQTAQQKTISRFSLLRFLCDTSNKIKSDHIPPFLCLIPLYHQKEACAFFF